MSVADRSKGPNPRKELDRQDPGPPPTSEHRVPDRARSPRSKWQPISSVFPGWIRKGT